MRRRDVLKSMAALTAAAQSPEALVGQQQGQAPAQAVPEEASAAALSLTQAEEAAEPVAEFFTAEEMSALRRLAEEIVPRTRTPGALEAGAPEFLDFYLGQSDRERQDLYREGLRRLNAEAHRRFGQPFAKLGVSQIEPLIEPLKQQWIPQPPPDPLAAFLRAAKDDLLRATMNSRQWAQAVEGRRRTSGATYWYPVE